MSTGQKYSGKGEDATPPITNGASINQTVENAEQTVNPTQQPTPDAELGAPKTYSFEDLQAFSKLHQEDKELRIQRHREGADINWPPLSEGTYTGGPFQFDDVLLYDRLTENGKFYADWVATSQSGYTADQLKLALDWLSKSPDSASPGDKVDGMSLQDILGGQVDPPAQPVEQTATRPRAELEAELTAILSDRLVDVEGVFTYKGRTYVRLTEYLEEALSSKEKADACREELRKVFTGYMLSDKFASVKGPDKTSKLIDLLTGITTMMARVDHHHQPRTLKTDITTEDILENVFKPEYHEAVMLEAGSITDVTMLQEWVKRLQGVVKLQMEINDNLNQLVNPRNELIEVMKATLLQHEATIERLQREAKRNAIATNYDIPKTHPYIDLTLYTDEDCASEVEVVCRALTEYRDKLGVKVLELIVNGETSEAFDNHQEQSQANNVLERLIQALTRLASSGYKVAEYTRDPSLFLKNVERKRNQDRREFKEFEKKYSTRYDVEEDEGNPEDSAQAAPQQPTE